MTPKEKAKEIMNSIFYRTYHIKGDDAKQCALIAVEEIISNTKKHSLLLKGEKIESDIYYWQEVKNEIEKL